MDLKNMTAQEICQAVEKAAIMEVGDQPAPVIEKLEWAGKNKPSSLFVGVSNADFSDFLVGVLLAEKENFALGLSAVLKVTGVSGIVLGISEFNQTAGLEAYLTDCSVPVTVQRKMRDQTAPDEAELFLHAETVLAIGELLSSPEQYAAKKYVSITADGKQYTGAVPYGVTFRQMIQTIAGDIADIKAVIVGGVTGTILSNSDLDKTVDVHNIKNGSIEVLSKNNCIVACIKDGMGFAYGQSCGKCTYCREGSYQLKSMFQDMTDGKANAADPDSVTAIASAMQPNCLCPRGQYVSGFFASIQPLFADEIKEHAAHKKCPAGVCMKAARIGISGLLCKGCGDCMDACKYNAIEGKPGYISMIDELSCVQCGDCIKVCPNGAITVLEGKKNIGPTTLTRAGRYRKP